MLHGISCLVCGVMFLCVLDFNLRPQRYENIPEFEHDNVTVCWDIVFCGLILSFWQSFYMSRLPFFEVLMAGNGHCTGAHGKKQTPRAARGGRFGWELTATWWRVARLNFMSVVERRQPNCGAVS